MLLNMVTFDVDLENIYEKKKYKCPLIIVLRILKDIKKFCWKIIDNRN